MAVATQEYVAKPDFVFDPRRPVLLLSHSIDRASKFIGEFEPRSGKPLLTDDIFSDLRESGFVAELKLSLGERKNFSGTVTFKNYRGVIQLNGKEICQFEDWGSFLIDWIETIADRTSALGLFTKVVSKVTAVKMVAIRVTHKGKQYTYGYEGFSVKREPASTWKAYVVDATPTPVQRPTNAIQAGDGDCRYNNTRFIVAMKLSDFNPAMPYLTKGLELTFLFESPANGQTRWDNLKIVYNKERTKIRYFFGSPDSGASFDRPVDQAFKTLDGLIKAVYREFRWSNKYVFLGQVGLVTGVQVGFKNMAMKSELRDA